MSSPCQLDPLEEVIYEHKNASEWFRNLQEAVRLGLEGGTFEVHALEEYFRVNVREHFMFEETTVFPALLTVDPRLAPMFEQLRQDHLEILGETARLFAQLALLATRPGDPDLVESSRLAFQNVMNLILRHARQEDQHLMPALRLHREAVRTWIQAMVQPTR